MGRRPPGTLSDPAGDLIREVPASAQRAVGLDCDAPLAAGFEQSAPVLTGTELHLVDHGPARAGRNHFVKFADAGVRNANGPGDSELPRTFHARPGPGRTALRPVDQVDVDLVHA